jgi:5-methylcytosine-specific restriction protein A
MPNSPKKFKAQRLTTASIRKPRLSSSERGYGGRWQKYRDWFLRQPQNRFCSVEGCRTPPSVVDHDPPHRGDMEKFWDERTHRAMCAYHHRMKTCAEDGGFGNPVEHKGY